ncbi:branched-chain alpha-ketoacid dehydrogenase kinase [Limtongia smithiae]|uniref:branched-chain alpha-ketoacid dehydrogenase kinase n=1 Tax=Limtongia smithiae TaxID=1125753 RepID=UPI0034CFD102
MAAYRYRMGSVQTKFLERCDAHVFRRISTGAAYKPKFSLGDPVFGDFNIEQVIDEYAHVPTKKLTMSDLLKFGRPPVPLSHLLENANTIRHALLCSLSRRAHALRSLPYIMMLNPNISTVYHKYLVSLHQIHQSTTTTTGVVANLSTAEENDDFVAALERMMDAHTDAVPVLAKGVSESSSYITPVHANRFLDAHMRDRISVRLAASHHIALTRDTNAALGYRHDKHHHHHERLDRYVGVVDTKLRPSQMCLEVGAFLSELSDLQYGVRPGIEVVVGEDVEVAYVPDHLEYILTEIIKNAFRASVEYAQGLTPTAEYRAKMSGGHNGSASSSSVSTRLKKVQATIVRTATGVQIRLRDQGGGIADRDLHRIWGYAESTFDEDVRDEGFKTLNAPPPSVTGIGGSSMGGLGYGLPLSRAYAEYFGGNLKLESIYGWGTDAYITINTP